MRFLCDFTRACVNLEQPLPFVRFMYLILPKLNEPPSANIFTARAMSTNKLLNLSRFVAGVETCSQIVVNLYPTVDRIRRDLFALFW